MCLGTSPGLWGDVMLWLESKASGGPVGFGDLEVPLLTWALPFALLGFVSSYPPPTKYSSFLYVTLGPFCLPPIPLGKPFHPSAS